MWQRVQMEMALDEIAQTDDCGLVARLGRSASDLGSESASHLASESAISIPSEDVELTQPSVPPTRPRAAILRRGTSATSSVAASEIRSTVGMQMTYLVSQIPMPEVLRPIDDAGSAQGNTGQGSALTDEAAKPPAATCLAGAAIRRFGVGATMPPGEYVAQFRTSFLAP